MPTAFIPPEALRARLKNLKEWRERRKRMIAEEESDAARAEEEGRPIEGDIVKEDELYKAICDNDWESAKSLIEKQPNALKSKITASGKSPFHMVALFGHVSIMEELVKQLDDPDFLETVDDFGNTPLLLIAAATGIIHVAQCLVDKNRNLLTIPDFHDDLPTTVAFLSGHYEMGRYLYHETPLECLKPRDYPGRGPTLLHCCFQTQCLDIVLHLLNHCQELLFASDYTEWKPIHGIATMNSAIPSPNELWLWQQWIYDYVDTNSTRSSATACLPIQQHEGTRERAGGKLTRLVAAGHRSLQCLISSAYNFIGINKIKEMKLVQEQAYGIVQLACKNARKKDRVDDFVDALFLAVAEGNVEFVVQISKAYPEILFVGDSSYRNIIYHAIKHRQARVFNLIHGLHFKDLFATSKDAVGNTLLHAAAEIAPDNILNRIYGPALQMQRELQWFREVERLMPSNFRVLQNDDGKTARELFRERHAKLMEHGEVWIKATASSYSLVAILIVTITFAVAFTLPGGNDQNYGFPLFIKQPTFNVFMLSTIISLVSSSTSVLMFLAILTSPFSEAAFLEFLPSKLLFGVLTLLISIVTMIITFLSAIRLTIKHTNHPWGIIPIILFTSVPISYSLFSLFPVIRNTAFSAYGSVFDRKAKPWP